MHAFEVLGDPVRRRILELLAAGEQSSGAVTAAIQAEFGISQPAVSQHLRVLRDSGFATVRPSGARRLYAVNPAPLQDVDAWLGNFRRFWTPPLMALATELARERRERARQAGASSGPQAQAATEEESHDRRHASDQHGGPAGRHPGAGGGGGAGADHQPDL